MSTPKPEVQEILKTQVNIRVYPETRRLLRILAARKDITMALMLHQLVLRETKEA